MDKKNRPADETRICAVCGEEFGVNCFQRRKIYCDNCKKKAYHDLTRRYKTKMRQNAVYMEKQRLRTAQRRKENYIPPVRTCKLCGKKFTTGKGGVAKYCIECLEEHQYQSPFREWYLARLDRLR